MINIYIAEFKEESFWLFPQNQKTGEILVLIWYQVSSVYSSHLSRLYYLSCNLSLCIVACGLEIKKWLVSCKGSKIAYLPLPSYPSINREISIQLPPGNNYPSNQHHTVDIQVASVFEGNNIVGIDDPLQILNRKLRLRNCLVTFVIFFALDFICFLRFFFLPRTLVALFGGPLYYFYSPWYLWLILVAGFQFFFISQLFGGIRYIKYIKWIGKTFFPQQQRSMSEIDGGGDRIQDAHRLDQPLHVYLQGDEHIQHSDKFESPMTANEDDPPPPVAKQVILPGDISIRSLAIPADVEGEDMDERRGESIILKDILITITITLTITLVLPLGTLSHLQGQLLRLQ